MRVFYSNWSNCYSISYFLRQGEISIINGGGEFFSLFVSGTLFQYFYVIKCLSFIIITEWYYIIFDLRSPTSNPPV